MPTRAFVRVENFHLCGLYKHSGGSPENILPFLEEFNKKFTKERGVDNEQKMAQLLRATMKRAKKYKFDTSLEYGYALFPVGADLGQEFEYLLKEDGSVIYIVL